MFNACGRENGIFGSVELDGPLFSYVSATIRADKVFKPGVALIGDSAMKPDPIWGQGMAMALRDADTLSTCLKKHRDWDEAGQEYMELEKKYADTIHRAERIHRELFLKSGEEAEIRRQVVADLLLAEPHRKLDQFYSGPDYKIIDQDAEDLFLARDKVLRKAA
jgi:2-polyprenyl-6-methoxyphenol hydroxylase-like FAD-dependent oxidoreductase